MSALAPGTLVRLNLTRRPRFVSVKHTPDNHDGNLALIIKSVGKDPNDHEYFEVLVNDQVLMAWDDELEKRD
jgi:hypothetical protein